MKPESPWQRRLWSAAGLLGVTVIITATQPDTYWAHDAVEDAVAALDQPGDTLSVPLVVTLTTPSLVHPGDGALTVEVRGLPIPKDTSGDSADTAAEVESYRVLVTLSDACGAVEQSEVLPKWGGGVSHAHSLSLGFRARTSETVCGDCAFSDGSCQVSYTLAFELLEGPRTELSWSAEAWYGAAVGWCRGYPGEESSLTLEAGAVD